MSNVERPPKGRKLIILIPMAGRGSRFAKVGFKLPKPLIDTLGKPMVQWVIDNFEQLKGKNEI
jgi:NDP-sugar pyrophosphorylase family protein